MTVKNLILDLDNTLYGYDVPHKIALSAVLETFSITFNISKEQTKHSFAKFEVRVGVLRIVLGYFFKEHGTF